MFKMIIILVILESIPESGIPRPLNPISGFQSTGFNTLWTEQLTQMAIETLKIGYKASKPISDVLILHGMTTIDTMPESDYIVGQDFR